MQDKIVDLTQISPKALSIIEELSKTSGLESDERVVEEMAFTIKELLQVIDTDKDPLLEPEVARRQIETLKGVLQRFKRFK